MKFSSARDDEPELNLIPMIDILLVVLIFLMVATTYTRSGAIDVSLPGADRAPSEKRSEVFVEIGRDGIVAIDGRLVGSAKEPKRLAESMGRLSIGSGSPVVVRADKNAPHQFIIGFMEAAASAGVDQLAFATVRQESEP